MWHMTEFSLLCCYYNLHKNSQTVKKRCGLCKKGSMKKVVKSKVAVQKWLWWSDNGKIFNNNNSVEFLLPLPTGNCHQNSPELLLLKILPLSDHHSYFWAATFDFTTFFMLPFFHGPNLLYPVTDNFILWVYKKYQFCV